jgi:hypothetical protein
MFAAGVPFVDLSKGRTPIGELLHATTTTAMHHSDRLAGQPDNYRRTPVPVTLDDGDGAVMAAI